jgi:transposase-like protein
LRASTQSRRELRRELKRRGLKQDPKPANGDDASGFWTALRKVFATSQEHHCRVHKTVNVMRAMPKSVQAKAKGHLHDIRQARTKATANAAVNVVAEICVVTRDKAVAKPVKDRGALPTFL